MRPYGLDKIPAVHDRDGAMDRADVAATGAPSRFGKVRASVRAAARRVAAKAARRAARRAIRDAVAE